MGQLLTENSSSNVNFNKLSKNGIFCNKISAYFWGWQGMNRTLERFPLVIGEGVQVTDVDGVLFVLPARRHPGADFKVGRIVLLLHAHT